MITLKFDAGVTRITEGYAVAFLDVESFERNGLPVSHILPCADLDSALVIAKSFKAGEFIDDPRIEEL